MSHALAFAMSTEQTIAWVAVGLLGLAGSAVYSGLETGVYRLNRIRLHLYAHQRERRARILDRMIRNPNRMLGTLLIGNNIANYASSLSIAALLGAAGYTDRQVILIVAVVLTPLLFVFGEVLPKDFFGGYTDRVTYHFARFLRWNELLFSATLLLPIVDRFSRLLAWLFRSKELARLSVHPRRAVTEMMREGIGQGLLSPYQSDMIDRVLHPTERTVGEAMVPWASVRTLRAGSPAEAAWALADRAPHTRFPVVDQAGRVVGVLNIFDVLLHEPAECPPLEDLARDVPRLPRQTPLREAMATLRRERSALALVVNASGKPIGVVTTKDLVEPITGDLAVW